MTSKLKRHELVCQGLCISCRERSDNGAMCLKCKNANAERTVMLRERREAAGLCVYCGIMSFPDRTCRGCRERRKRNRVESVGN